MGYARRFNDLIGLGYEGYPTLLALALYAWHEKRGQRRSASSMLYEVLPGSDWFREKAARGVVSSLDSRGYLEFECQSLIWRPGGWRRCPKEWRLTVRGYERLQGLLQNIGLTLEDVLGQPSPLDVKKLIDSRIKAVYREHWERVRRYEEVVAGEGGL
jgi:hypothetical protein